jgi:anti-anti-sigma regulatory factor
MNGQTDPVCEFEWLSDKDGIVRLRLTGDLRPAVMKHRTLGQRFGQDIYSRVVLLDLSASPLFNTDGFGWLRDNQTRFTAAGGRCVIHSLSLDTRDALAITRLDRALLLADDEVQAEIKVLEGGS